MEDCAVSSSVVIEKGIGSDRPKGRYCVLIVDDNKAFADSLSALLSLHDLETRIVPGVSAAIQLMQEESKPPDLILSDMYMPGKSGIDLFRELRSQSSWSEIPFILLSADYKEEDIREGIRLGADNFLRKPIEMEELRAIIQGKISRIEQRKEIERARIEGFKKKIIHTLSHEFRTPLVSITTGTELLIEEEENLSRHQVKNLLKSILRGGQRLERLVEDFMLLQQIDGGDASSTYSEFKSPTSISELVERIEGAVKEKFADIYPSHCLRIDLPHELRKIKIQMFLPQLTDAFCRLIDNAYKFSPKKLECELGIRMIGSSINFSFRDWGSGLPPGFCPKEEAITHFTQIKRDVYEQQGCGVGLSIASYFITLHGGSISLVTPENENGLEVRVVLPTYR